MGDIGTAISVGELRPENYWLRALKAGDWLKEMSYLNESVATLELLMWASKRTIRLESMAESSL